SYVLGLTVEEQIDGAGDFRRQVRRGLCPGGARHPVPVQRYERFGDASGGARGAPPSWWAAAGQRRRPCAPGLLFLDDPDLHLRPNIRMEADRHGVDTQRLERLLEHDLSAVDLDPLLRQLPGDVARGDRPEQP